MPAPDPVITVVREWLRKADHDLTAAAHLLTLGADCPTDTVGFHAQQCAEKCIKALLVFRATPFPRTHDIRLLRALLDLGLVAYPSVLAPHVLAFVHFSSPGLDGFASRRGTGA